MSEQELKTIHAWRDRHFRAGLSQEERTLLPDNPAGFIDLDEQELDRIVGASTAVVFTAGCCYYSMYCTGFTCNQTDFWTCLTCTSV